MQIGSKMSRPPSKVLGFWTTQQTVERFNKVFSATQFFVWYAENSQIEEDFQMSVGAKIREYRSKLNLTQKDLAEKLNVTYQAVSRWEKDEVEPSFDSLTKMSQIFDCSIDDLFGIERPRKGDDAEEKVKIVEKVVEQGKPILSLCENCNKPIYEQGDLHRFDLTIRNGRTNTTRSCVFCTRCNDQRLAKEREEEKAKRAEEAAGLRKKRLRSFVWSGLIAAVLLAISILVFSGGTKKDIESGAFYLVLSVLAFCFASCCFLDNNFVGDMWLSVAAWGFVKMPGVIFEFSLDGFIIGIVIKIILAILGLLLGLITTLLATILGLAVAIFVYPFAIAKNFRDVKKLELEQ